MTDVETSGRRERAGLAPAGGLAEPERRPLARRAARPAIPRRRVRADRREGHDRVHDPRGHRPVEAVAARLLPVLRRQGRAAPRPVRGDGPRVDRRPARASSSPSPDPIDRLRAFTIRLHEWCDPSETPRKRGAHNRRPIMEFSVQLTVNHPDRVKAAMAPISRMMFELVDAANAAGAIDVRRRPPGRVAHAADGHVHWFGNRLVENGRMRLTAEDDVGVLPPRPRAARRAGAIGRAQTRSRSSIRIALPRSTL